MIRRTLGNPIKNFFLEIVQYNQYKQMLARNENLMLVIPIYF